MNLIKKIIIKKQKIKEYKNYIHDHKINVIRAFYEFLNCKELEDFVLNLDTDALFALWDRVLDHDESKYDKIEFEAYRKEYYPIDAQERRLNKLAFDKAWEHHWKTNDHHWQHRQDWPDEELDINTKLACIENVLDWLAMGYQFNDRPYQYYEKHKEEIKLPSKQKEFIEYLIYQGIDKERIPND